MLPYSGLQPGETEMATDVSLSELCQPALLKLLIVLSSSECWRLVPGDCIENMRDIRDITLCECVRACS